MRFWNQKIVFILAGCLLTSLGCTSDTPETTQNGSKITLRVGQHQIEADSTQLTSTDYTGLGAFSPGGSGATSDFAANVLTLKFDAARDIRARYPNYNSCGSGAQREIQSQMKPLTLIPATDTAKTQILDLVKQLEKGDTWISFKVAGKELYIEEHLWDGKPLNLTGMGKHILVDQIDYLF